MPRNSKAQFPPGIPELLSASESLYNATKAEIAARRRLPDDAISPSHIAFSVAMLALEYQIACPVWARDSVLRDWARFEGFECASISEAFGIPDTTFAHKHRTELLSAAIYHRVRELKRQKVPQKDNATRKGSLSIVGEEFHISPAQVKQRMAEWQKLCRATGADPDAPPKYANARKMITATIARAIAPRAKKNQGV